MADQDKIEKLQRAVEEHPNNEMAQFALGSALLEAGRHEDAGPCFQRVLAINSQNSKAHELLGTAQILCGLRDLAVETLTNGYRVAHRRGDLMPMNAMADLLKELNAEVPTVGSKPEAGKDRTSADGFSCRRCGGGGPPLDKPPYKGELGDTILSSVCEPCWQEWLGMGTRVINELRLPMYDPQAQEMYNKHMKEFLLIE